MLVLLAGVLFPTAHTTASESASLFSGISAGRYEHLFRIDGSNTIGAELAPALVRAWMTTHGAESVERLELRENETRLIGFVPDINAHVLVDIAAHGSGTGFKALAAGTSDIAAASRPVKAKEQALLPYVNLTDMQSEHIVGIDGLAIIVDPSNPFDELSVAELKRIFSGEVTDWSQLGGAQLPITVFARDDQSGTWDSFRHMVLGKTALTESAERFESNNELSDRVSSTRGAIGFVGLASVRQAKLMAVSAGDAPSLRPDKLTVATEDYALSRRLYLYSKGVSDNRFARDFLDFVAHEGQAQVAAVGFVSQDVVALTPANVAQLPSAMQSQVQGAYRLSVNFRFNAGSARLDNKAQRDIDRVLEFVSSNEDAEILLFGFASESDNPGRAELLSKHRAMAVSRALRQAAVYPEALTGMGAQAPVANIEGNDGRQKNSRVEVWVKAPQSIAGAE